MLDLMTQSLVEMSDVLAITEKSIASVARKFQAQLRGLTIISMTGGGSILADVRQAVKDGIENAYIEGMIEGGLTPDDVTADDAQMIDELNLTQQDFVTDFVKAIRQAQGDKAAQRDILDNRIPLWTASIEAAGMQGLASAKKNEMVTWHLGATEEHCKTCNQLNGQSHRRSWFASRNYFPQTPGASLECGGFNCQCTLE